MQNYTKSQTRLAFVQYIFQNELLNVESPEDIEDFQQHNQDNHVRVQNSHRAKGRAVQCT